MTKDENKNIFFHNIYYMLSYAFMNLKEEDQKRISGEVFDNVHGLLAEILFLAVKRQIRRGLYKQFEPFEDSFPTIKGKLLFNETIKQKASGEVSAECRFDEFTENNLFNQIVKTTIDYLFHSPELGKEGKRKLASILPFLSVVDVVDLRNIHWKNLVYQRNNGDYRLIIGICRLLVDDMILSTEQGKTHAQMFSDSKMERLYEQFLRNYYRKEHPELTTNASKIKWALDFDDAGGLLPEMRTDITLTKGEKTLIIDAKYYGETLKLNQGKYSFNSGHIYQIHAYVKNADRQHTGNVSGVVLYAKPADVPVWDSSVKTIDGNRFAFRLLNLNLPFAEIRKSLDDLAQEFLEG